MDKDPIKKVEDLTKKVNDYMEKQGGGVLSRYPLLFSLLATFGIVCTLYGFERVIESVPILGDSPFLILLLGIGLLIFTGSLFKHFRSHPPTDNKD